MRGRPRPEARRPSSDVLPRRPERRRPPSETSPRASRRSYPLSGCGPQPSRSFFEPIRDASRCQRKHFGAARMRSPALPVALRMHPRRPSLPTEALRSVSDAVPSPPGRPSSPSETPLSANGSTSERLGCASHPGPRIFAQIVSPSGFAKSRGFLSRFTVDRTCHPRSWSNPRIGT